jgi:hypothetical protein
MADLPPALVQPQGQVQYVPAANGMGVVPSRSGAASPGFSGAILDAIRAIAGAVAPRGLVQRPQAVRAAVAQGEGGLGDQLVPPQ